MEGRRIAVFETCVGSSLIVIGLILWWWSKQLVWILIYPPPLAKQLLESLPFVFWCLGALLIVDGVRRKIQGSENLMVKTIIIVNNYRKPEYRPRIRQLVAALEEAGAQCNLFDYTESIDRMHGEGVAKSFPQFSNVANIVSFVSPVDAFW